MFSGWFPCAPSRFGYFLSLSRSRSLKSPEPKDTKKKHESDRKTVDNESGKADSAETSTAPPAETQTQLPCFQPPPSEMWAVLRAGKKFHGYRDQSCPSAPMPKLERKRNPDWLKFERSLTSPDADDDVMTGSGLRVPRNVLHSVGARLCDALLSDEDAVRRSLEAQRGRRERARRGQLYQRQQPEVGCHFFPLSAVQRWGIHFVHSCTTGDNSFRPPPRRETRPNFAGHQCQIFGNVLQRKCKNSRLLLGGSENFGFGVRGPYPWRPLGSTLLVVLVLRGHGTAQDRDF